MLVNYPDRLESIEVLSPLPSCAHCPIVVSCIFLLSDYPVDDDVTPTKLWSLGRYDLIASALEDFDWVTEFEFLDVQDKYSKFLNIMNSLIDRCAYIIK